MYIFIHAFHSVRNDESRHPNRYWTKVALIATLVQIVAAIVVLISLTVARDEHPQAPLLIWFIGYTCGCIANLPVISWRFHTFNQDLSESTAPVVDEEDNFHVVGHERIHKVMEFFKTALEFFFVGWFFGYQWFFYDKPSPDDVSILYWLSMFFLAFSCIRHGVIISTLCFLCIYLPWCICLHSVIGVVRLVIVVIKALYACFSRSNDVDSEWEGEDISCCCICLGKCGEEEDGLTRKLTCSHVFHLECIETWLRIKPTCPLCQSQINMSPTLLSTNNNCTTLRSITSSAT